MHLVLRKRITNMHIIGQAGEKTAQIIRGTRPAFMLLTPRSHMNNATNNGLKTKCCYCGLIRTGVEWHHSAEESEALVSHGVCPTCVV